MKITRSRRAGSRVRPGFTIIEVIVIVVILGVIAAVIGPRLIGRIGQSKQAVAKANASALATQIKLFAADFGMPEPGAGITILWEKPGAIDETAWRGKGPYVNNPQELLDPWGNAFELRIPGEKNVDFDVISYGADGQPGGEGENADIIAP
ncbi:MAG: type II secretion system major pseudopilin GspG [Phycisphaeraceae bacterium]|nr:type II secretion system major pseudopilin GspG [Phycisphaerae bacterium]MBX3391754.1 type II secretion system major pseudopilin GspG [Phycisphaeraceae bacterium]HRJ50607.1 type II secretion system major pseudopilin GspG [Phycisphaerales bacterium]